MKPTYIDLFAGCGGFSSGLEMAGFDGVLHLEQDEWACETLAANFGSSSVLCSDIRSIPDSAIRQFQGVDMVVGGPPCQGFSVAGSTQFGVIDPRNELVLWYLKWVEIVRPKVFVIENVPGILSKRDKSGRTVPELVSERLAPLGYSVNAALLNAADFGVPQTRTRAFLFGSLPGFKFIPPSPSHQALANVATLFERPPSHVTVGDALSDLPTINAGEGSDDVVQYSCDAANPYQVLMRSGSEGVRNHVAMKHTQRLINRFSTIKQSQSLKDVGLEHGQLRKMTAEVNPEPFKYNNYRLAADRPALTIPASFQSLFLHPQLHRNLTAREAARLMSFPDRFVFKGKRTTMSWEKHLSQYNQIGNAVCPLVGASIGSAALAALRGGVDKTAAKRSVKRAFASISAHASTKLTPPSPAPSLDVLNDMASAFMRDHPTISAIDGSGTISRLGLSFPVAAIPLALIIATEAQCRICRPDLAPHAAHMGEIPFLISKEATETLEANENDHGLDFHLRKVLGVHHQIGHAVGELIEELGLGQVAMRANPRTGRQVRTLVNVKCPVSLEPFRLALFQAKLAAA